MPLAAHIISIGSERVERRYLPPLCDDCAQTTHGRDDAALLSLCDETRRVRVRADFERRRDQETLTA